MKGMHIYIYEYIVYDLLHIIIIDKYLELLYIYINNEYYILVGKKWEITDVLCYLD